MAVLEHPERYVIFGEQHGTQQAPAQFGEVACVAARQGPVVVALEQSEALAPVFERYMASNGSAAARADFHQALTPMMTPDGRSSVAMFALFDRLQALKLAGADIRVIPFQHSTPDGADGSQTPYEIGLATTLASKAGQATRVLVLVGSLHARRKTFAMAGFPPIDPMAMHLPSGSTLTLVAQDGPGEAWQCAPQCGVHKVGDPSQTTAPGITLFDQPTEGFDGRWSVGPVSASPPYKVTD